MTPSAIQQKRFLPIALFAAAAMLGAGCVAIPMGKETFTTEYPTDIRATWDPPTKTYEPSPVVDGGGEDRRTVAIGLAGNVISTQPQVQHYEKVTVEKRKRFAFGFFPQSAESVFRPKKALVPQTTEYYKGDGKYSSNPSQLDSKALGSCVGFWLLLNTPVSLLYGPFAPYEKDVHYMGRFLSSTSSSYGNVIHVNNSFSAQDIEALCRFSPEERKRIGAWTYRENAAHPHNTFWNGFSSLSLFGFDKHCYYLVHDPEKLSRTTPVDPKVTTSNRKVPGPYTVTLNLPSVGYLETAAVDPGAKTVQFDLAAAANGDPFAEGTVRYALPTEGAAAVRNADDRAILEMAASQEWPVRIALPDPQPGATPAPGAGPASVIQPAPAGASLYSISAIEQSPEGGLVVRVTVNDTSRTFDIDRIVQPEIRRIFRDQFATGENAARKETVQWKTGDGGKVLVYTVSFE